MVKKKEKIILCIPTCNRDQQLKKLLISIGKQRNLPCEYTFEVLVINNDSSNDIANVIYGLENFHFPIYSILVKERGYSNVRNRAVGWVLNRESAALIFIDDDELVPPDWLASMVEAWRACQGDIVTGPVEQVLPSSAGWVIRKFSLMERNYYAKTGAKLQYANSNNTLVSSNVLKIMGPTFHQALNHSGGEDTLFFHQCYLNGFSIYWDNSVLIKEPTLPERATLNYVLKRWFKYGTTQIRLNTIMYPDNWKRVSLQLVLNTAIGILKKLAMSIVKADSKKFGETVCTVSKLAGLSVQIMSFRAANRI